MSFRSPAVLIPRRHPNLATTSTKRSSTIRVTSTPSDQNNTTRQALDIHHDQTALREASIGSVTHGEKLNIGASAQDAPPGNTLRTSWNQAGCMQNLSQLISCSPTRSRIASLRKSCGNASNDHMGSIRWTPCNKSRLESAVNSCDGSNGQLLPLLTFRAGIRRSRKCLTGNSQDHLARRQTVRSVCDLRKSNSVQLSVEKLAIANLHCSQHSKRFQSTTLASAVSSTDVSKAVQSKVFRNGWAKMYKRLLYLHWRQPHGKLEFFKPERRLAQQWIERIDTELLADKLKPLVSKEQELVCKLLVGSLVTSAEQTLLLLSNMEHLPCDFLVRMDCLLYVDSFYRDQLVSDVLLRHKFESELSKQRSPIQWPAMGMNGRHFDLLLRGSSAPQCDAMIDMYLAQQQHAQPSVLQRITAYYLRTQQPEKAFQIMIRLPPKFLESPDANLIPLCATLLKYDTVIETETGPNFKYLSKLLELGFRPDAMLHSRIISNALEAGFANVAWDIYQHLGSEEAEIAPPVYLMLLKHAFIAEDVKRVNDIMSAIHRREDLCTHPFIIAFTMNMVRNICYYQKKTPAYEALSHILAIYDRAYTRAPLIKLGIVDADPNLTTNDQPEPPANTLSFTLWSYLLTHRRSRYGDGLWNWIKQLATQGDRLTLEMLQQDVIYNGFILFYARWERTLIRGLGVVQYMLDNTYCQPTSRTWSLLVCAFLKHRKIDEAQKVMDLMHLHGYEITTIGEEHLPHGYSLKDLDLRKDQVLDDSNLPTEMDLMTRENMLSAMQGPRSIAPSRKQHHRVQGKGWDGIVHSPAPKVVQHNAATTSIESSA